MTIKVDDVNTAYDEAQRRGYRIVHPLIDEVWGHPSLLRSQPDGHLINVAGHRK